MMSIDFSERQGPSLSDKSFVVKEDLDEYDVNKFIT